ncbi:MAG: peptide chain release factor N(5)-glutamine methyltransferase [Planctomycetota bacterium]|nr:MAG: peptide chain release factor N(5)-glutamine methyltransferase [Planctomycetota bacterium]
MLAAAARILRRAGVDEPRAEAECLWEGVSGTPRAQLRSGRAAATAAHARRFHARVRRRAAGEPLAYVEGEVEFYGLRLRVDRRVLIPRPDSETVVDAALPRLPPERATRVLDLGTGSGCLLLALLSQRPRARGLGVDRSAGALALAAENARRLGLGTRAGFVRGSWLDAVAPGCADLIVSNPPYVEPSEALGPGVAEHEPHLALFTPPGQPYRAYDAILHRARVVLRPGGALVLEAGAGRARALAERCAAAGLRVLEVRRDLGGIERAVAAVAP